MSFDSMRDAFYDTLLDMESGAEDFSEDFSEYLQKAILKTSLSKVYDKRLQEWYDKFANYNKEGGIDTGEYKDLQQEWNDIVKDALEERDSLKDIFGWTSSSSLFPVRPGRNRHLHDRGDGRKAGGDRQRDP